MKKKCSFIIGSGSSLLDLTDNEKEYLNNEPNTLAMNKYLLFATKVGVIPKNLFLADKLFPAQMVVDKSLQIAKSTNSSMRFYLHKYYRDFYGPYRKSAPLNLEFQANGLKCLVIGFLKRLKLFYKHKYFVGYYKNMVDIEYFKFGQSSDEIYWAESLSNNLYFYRGSLTTAINLAYLIFPSTDIYLLGVDLNSNISFYADEVGKISKYERRADAGHKQRMEMASHFGKHATALPYMGMPGIHTVIPLIAAELNKKGVKLYCCNQKSLLVRDGLCPYRSLSECYGQSIDSNR